MEKYLKAHESLQKNDSGLIHEFCFDKGTLNPEADQDTFHRSSESNQFMS